MNKILDFFKNIKLPTLNFQFKKPVFKFPKFGRPNLRKLIFWGVTLALVVAGFVFSRSFWTCWTMTRLPGVPPASCGVASVDPLGTPQVNRLGTPVAIPTGAPEVAAPEVNLPPAWDGASRVTLLFMGLDYRDYIANQGPPRTDTMILFTIDPQSKTAGMLSIPRDLWVNIPGYGYSRINTAYPTGEGNKLPGGGPGLAMKTVEQFIGVPIQYYAQVDFQAFEEAIDAMGGLYICIPQKIRIDPIGNKRPENLQAGCQTLHGYQVLAYARNRYTANGDVDRANRQQLVIMALRDQVFSPQNFPAMITKAPKIYKEASVGLRTNLSFEDAMKLGVLLSQIPPENIKRAVIDNSMVVMDNTVLDGQNAAVLKPIADKIR